MIIAVIYNLTLLPALLVLFKPPAEADPVGYGWLAPADRFLSRHARRVVIAALVAGMAGAAALPIAAGAVPGTAVVPAAHSQAQPGVGCAGQFLG